MSWIFLCFLTRLLPIPVVSGVYSVQIAIPNPLVAGDLASVGDGKFRIYSLIFLF